MKEKLKKIKKKMKVIFKKENIAKAIVIVSSLALLATSVLPFIL